MNLHKNTLTSTFIKTFFLMYIIFSFITFLKTNNLEFNNLENSIISITVAILIVLKSLDEKLKN